MATIAHANHNQYPCSSATAPLTGYSARTISPVHVAHQGDTLLRSAYSCILMLVAAAPVSAQSVSRYVGTARHRLEFSGAVVSITEKHLPISNRTFTLTGANGHILNLDLHNGGTEAGNSPLNLFVAEGAGAKRNDYYVLSKRDCVEFDPVRIVAEYCAHRPPCDGQTVIGLTYLGRFDWMNGFDPPRGRFGLAFRYLPAEDAAESGSCPTHPD